MALTEHGTVSGAAVITLPAPPRSRLLLGMTAALLVNAGLLLFLQRDRPAVKAASRLIALRILPSETIPERRPPPRAAPATAPTARTIAVPAPEVAVTAPALAAPVATTVATKAAEPASAATAGPTRPEPLKLALPAGRPASGPRSESMLSQMLNDPRANSEKRSVEYAVADAAGTLPVVVQDATDGTGNKLVRQGSKCTRVVTPRIGMLNPMDPRAQGFAGMAGSCFTK